MLTDGFRPFFVVFGALSDKIGRKKIMLAGCFLAALTYVPIHHALESAVGNNVVTVKSTRNKLTNAISLMPMTTDAAGALVPAKEATNPNQPMLAFLIFIQAIWVCMVFGPIAAYLVGAFPARIQHTSLSLPYQIGNGVFGGMLPLIALSWCAATGNICAGLYYPIMVASITFIVDLLIAGDVWHKNPGRAGGRAGPTASLAD